MENSNHGHGLWTRSLRTVANVRRVVCARELSQCRPDDATKEATESCLFADESLKAHNCSAAALLPGLRHIGAARTVDYRCSLSFFVDCQAKDWIYRSVEAFKFLCALLPTISRMVRYVCVYVRIVQCAHILSFMIINFIINFTMYTKY